MEYDFSELDASLAQLNAEFAGLESGINELNEDPFTDFSDSKAKKSENYEFFSDWDDNNNTNNNRKPSRDPLDAALEELDHITPRGNTLDKALNEIDALIETPDIIKKSSSKQGKLQQHQHQHHHHQQQQQQIPIVPARSRKSNLELGNRRVMMGTSRQPGVSAAVFDGGKHGSGALFFKAPEMIDLKGVSLEEVQRIVLTFHDQLVRMAEEANMEIQECNKQIQILDEDNEKAFKTIQDLQSDLNNQQEDWNNSDKQLKTRVAKLEEEEKKLKNQLASSATSGAQIQGYEKEIEDYKHQLKKVKYESLQSSAPVSPGSPMDMERYKGALRTLNQKKTQLEKRVLELEQELLSRANTPGLQAQLETRDIEIQKLRQQVNYLKEEKKALQETFTDFTSVGLSEQLEKQLKSQQQEIESLNRQVAGSTAEKKILQGQLEQLEKDLSVKGSTDTVPLLKLRVRQLEAENESGNVKIRRLVAAIKADRAQSEEKLKELQLERDEQEQRADRFEAKMIQLIEMVRTERKKHEENNNQAALDAARDSLRETETQIRLANEAASAAERALQQKEQELQKVLLFGKKKAREAQNALEDVKALEDKSNKLVDAVRTLRADNLQLKSTGSRANLTGNGSLIEELEATSQRAQKLEQAVRKLRQMVSNLEAEAADKERAYEEGLKTAENRIKAAEERAKNVTAFSGLPSNIPGPPGAPPPPPPPLPKLKLTYDIRINRTGQATNIVGEPGQARNPRNIFVDSIVEAIKKGVTLKKTGLREYDENSTEPTEVSNEDKSDEFSMEDDFAAMAREIAINKQKRERYKTLGEAETTKKKGGELDNLLKELEDLDALIQ